MADNHTAWLLARLFAASTRDGLLQGAISRLLTYCALCQLTRHTAIFAAGDIYIDVT